MAHPAELSCRIASLLAVMLESEADMLADGPALCGAHTRRGQPCQVRPEPGKQRCRFHGGRSTGPKTAEGRLNS
jgi:hypothetical protein